MSVLVVGNEEMMFHVAVVNKRGDTVYSKCDGQGRWYVGRHHGARCGQQLDFLVNQAALEFQRILYEGVK